MLGADAVTLSPYMGWDSVKPFVTGDFSHKGAFILCKTSNPSSSELQDRLLDGNESVYEHVRFTPTSATLRYPFYHNLPI